VPLFLSKRHTTSPQRILRHCGKALKYAEMTVVCQLLTRFPARKSRRRQSDDDTKLCYTPGDGQTVAPWLRRTELLVFTS